MSEGTIAAALGAFVAETDYGSLPAEVQEQAKLRLLDSLGCAVAGRDLPWSRMAVGLAQRERGPAAVIAHPCRTAAQAAALANGVLAHSVLQEDTGGMGHPSTIVVPAALAVAEELHATGRELLTAVAAGYEVMARVAVGASPELIARGFRSSSVFGVFGAAAAAAKVMRLPPEAVACALGYAANMAGGLSQGWWSGTMEPIVQAGLAARNGIAAAQLAAAGATVAADTLEGRSGFYRAFAGSGEGAERSLAGLATRYLMLETTVKPYPACALNQVPLDLGLSLAGDGLDSSQIERVVERVSALARLYPGSDAPPPYTSMIQAQMSAQFCLAAALMGLPVHDPAFYFERYRDPQIAALAEKVELAGEPDRGIYQVRIEIYMRDGRQLAIEEDRTGRLQPSVKGGVERFRTLAAGFLGQRTGDVVDRVLALDEAPEISGLMELTRGPQEVANDQ